MVKNLQKMSPESPGSPKMITGLPESESPKNPLGFRTSDNRRSGVSVTGEKL